MRGGDRVQTNRHINGWVVPVSRVSGLPKRAIGDDIVQEGNENRIDIRASKASINPHQIKQESHNVGFPSLRREEQGGHSVVAGGQSSCPGGMQRLADVQETTVRGVVERAVPRAELRVVGGVR